MEDGLSVIQSISLPAQFIPLVHEYLNGESVSNLAVKYGIDEENVVEFLNRREVKQFINTKLENYKYLSVQKRVDLLTRAVEEKLTFAEDNEMPITNKDLLEILKLLREESKDLRAKNEEVSDDSVKNTYINIVNQLKA
jgi:arsenate reductase-like glutaredoxin family protein